MQECMYAYSAYIHAEMHTDICTKPAQSSKHAKVRCTRIAHKHHPKAERALLTQLQIKVTLNVTERLFPVTAQSAHDLAPQMRQSQDMELTCYFQTPPGG